MKTVPTKDDDISSEIKSEEKLPLDVLNNYFSIGAGAKNQTISKLDTNILIRFEIIIRRIYSYCFLCKGIFRKFFSLNFILSFRYR